ncbi:hypothetical protein YC2023_081365 [Brassica napus]
MWDNFPFLMTNIGVTTRPVGTTCPVGSRLIALQRTDPNSSIMTFPEDKLSPIDLVIGDSLSCGNAVKG